MSKPLLTVTMAGTSISSIQVHVYISESVDSVCRDGRDMPYVAMQNLENSAKTIAIRLYGYLTFILEYSITTKTFKVAINHHGSTKLKFVKTANTAVSIHCSFHVNRQQFLVRRSTISQNLCNFSGPHQVINKAFQQLPLCWTPFLNSMRMRK